MIRRPTISTRTDTLFPYTTLFRSRLAALIEGRSEELAMMESLDTGKPLKVALGDVLTCARYFEFFSGVADKLHGEVIPATNEHFMRSEEHTSELQSLMRISYAVFCLKKKKISHHNTIRIYIS